MHPNPAIRLHIAPLDRIDHLKGNIPLPCTPPLSRIAMKPIRGGKHLVCIQHQGNTGNGSERFLQFKINAIPVRHRKRRQHPVVHPEV